MLTKEDIEQAMKKATIGHRGKWEVRRMMEHPDEYRDRLYNDLLSGEICRQCVSGIQQQGGVATGEVEGEKLVVV